MKLWKTLTLAATLSSSALLAGEMTEHIVQPYLSYTPVGCVSSCPHLGVRWQKDMFMVDASLGVRYHDKSTIVLLTKNVSYVFNPGSNSQNYMGVSGKYIWDAHWENKNHYHGAAVSLVLGKDYTMVNGKKMFAELHYTPWFQMDAFNTYPHLPEFKMGFAF